MLVVAAALFHPETKNILVQQRPEGSSMAGLWEFPGGKIEAGESPEIALCRELYEELHIHVLPSHCTPLTFSTYPLPLADGTTRPLLLLLYICTTWHSTPQPQEGQKLRWCTVEELDHLPMPPADLPFLDFLRSFVIKM